MTTVRSARRRSRRTSRCSRRRAPTGEPQQALEQRERLATLISDLETLSVRQRGALLMRELSGLSIEELAAALGTSASAAKQALFEARTALREQQEGRSMECEQITKLLWQDDRRLLRGRRVRSHMRSCAACREAQEALSTRSADLRLLAPPLPALVASAMLARLLGHATAGPLGAAGAGARRPEAPRPAGRALRRLPRPPVVPRRRGGARGRCRGGRECVGSRGTAGAGATSGVAGLAAHLGGAAALKVAADAAIVAAAAVGAANVVLSGHARRLPVARIIVAAQQPRSDRPIPAELHAVAGASAVGAPAYRGCSLARLLGRMEISRCRSSACSCGVAAVAPSARGLRPTPPGTYVTTARSRKWAASVVNPLASNGDPIISRTGFLLSDSASRTS